jgi:hypothetical protein
MAETMVKASSARGSVLFGGNSIFRRTSRLPFSACPGYACRVDADRTDPDRRLLFFLFNRGAQSEQNNRQRRTAFFASQAMSLEIAFIRR